MCFHSKQTKKAVEIEHRFKAKIIDPEVFKTSDHYNGFDFPKTPVIANTNISHIEHFQWGLIPEFESSDLISQFTLNARIDTLHEKRSFKDVIGNRCLIISTGFYEWQWLDEKGKKKQKYVLSLPGDELFAFGGLWSEWEDPTTGQSIKTYTIVTTEANEQMAIIHNNKKRMPVILAEDDLQQGWLEGEVFNAFYDVNPTLEEKKIIPYNPQTSLFD